MRPLKIVSGGQTGVDRAALDVAIELGIDHGGWCPRGRKAEDGRIPDRYQLTETISSGYTQRTIRNAREAGATMILTLGPVATPGTRHTIRIVESYRRRLLCVNLLEPLAVNAGKVAALLAERQWVLNIAGPRESRCPGIYDAARAFLLAVLR